MSDIQLRIDWWHVALLGAAALGLVALAFGWRPGALLALLGLGASAEKARRDSSTTPDDKPTNDDYQRPPIDDDESDPDKPTPDPGDGVDGDYWLDAHRRGSGD